MSAARRTDAVAGHRVQEVAGSTQPEALVQPLVEGHADGRSFKEDLFVPTAEGKSARLIGLTTVDEIREAKKALFEDAASYFSRAAAARDQGRH